MMFCQFFSLGDVKSRRPDEVRNPFVLQPLFDPEQSYLLIDTSRLDIF